MAVGSTIPCNICSNLMHTDPMRGGNRHIGRATGLDPVPMRDSAQGAAGKTRIEQREVRTGEPVPVWVWLVLSNRGITGPRRRRWPGRKTRCGCGSSTRLAAGASSGSGPMLFSVDDLGGSSGATVLDLARGRHLGAGWVNRPAPYGQVTSASVASIYQDSGGAFVSRSKPFGTSGCPMYRPILH